MIYLFNNNEEMIRIIPNSAIKRMYQTQKLTDENYISDRLDVEIQALNDEELSELEYMAIDDIENPQRFHYYFIVKETTEHQVTSLTGVQSGIEELRKTPVYDMRPTNLSPKLIADRLLEGTNWQTGYTTDDVGTISTNFYYTDVFSALKKMCMAFGIEMQFFVEITTNRIGARYIEFRKRTGKSVGKRVVYGHNALKIVKEVEKTNTITALIGRGKGVQVSVSDEGNIGYGRKIGFENVEWKKSSGAPVDKPLGQEFVEIPELTLQYGIKNSNGTVRPKIGFVEFQDEESETRLIDRTYNALLELSRPQVLLETSSVYLPDTGIGDTINVVRHDRDLRYKTRVFEITWDRLANQAVDMKLGDRLGESENKRISRISNQVSGNISTELGSTIEELADRLTSADGKNTNWYTDYDPMENPETMGLVRVNDNWWQPDPEYEGEFILKQWNGEMWVEILRTSGNPELVRRLEEAMAEAEQAKEAAEQAYEDSIAETERLVAEQNEVWQGKMNDYDNQVASIDASAKDAQTKVDQALRDVGISTNLAQTAKDLATTAQSNASTAISDASQAIIDAGGALSQAQALGGQFNDLSFEVDEINRKVDLRLTSAEVDSLVDGKGLAEVTYVDNQINATAEGFGSELTRVEGKIPSTFSTNNLIAKGDTQYSTTNYYVAEWDLLDKFEDDEEVTISVKGRTGHHNLYYHFYYGGGEIFLGTHKSIGRWKTEIVNLTFKWKNVGSSGQAPSSQKLRLYSHPPEDAHTMEIDWVVLSRGKLGVTEYVPALSEMVMDDDFTVFKNNYKSTVNDITSELSKTAKITDLNGMVTESYLTTNQYTTQGQINTQLVDYLKTTDLNNKVQETVAYQDIKETTDRYTRVIGSTDEESRTKIAQIAMTDSLFQTTVLDSIESGGRNLLQNTGDFSENTPPLYPDHDGFMSVAGREIRVGRTDRESKTVFRLSRDIQYGEKITISFIMLPWSSVNSRVRFSIGYSNASPWTEQAGVAGTEHRVKMTITAGQGFSEANYKPNNELWMIINYPFAIVEGSLMVEAGNLASNWTPAPEDKADQSQVTQLAGSWALTLKSAGDIKTQINATTDGIRLASNLIHLSGTSLIDNSVIKSAHIDSLNANKITGNTADFNTIRTGVLTADAVTSTHIKADDAFFEKVFSNTTATNKLVARGAWITNGNIKEIDAGKITTGELNAANVSIVNLDVNKLTGNAVKFISGAFTSNAGSLLLSGNGIRVNFNNGYNLRINGAGTNYYTSGGQPIGGLLTTLPIGGAAHSLSLNARRGYTVSMGYQGSLSYNQSNRALEVDGTTGNITIERPIYESSGSAGLEFTRSQMGNVGWGLLLASTKATGSGIFLADNGEVWIGISGGYKQFT